MASPRFEPVWRVALAVALSLAVGPAATAQVAGLRFEPVGGLSQRSVTCIYQDRYGFLWIGTEDGLNRFDGYEVTVFKNDSEDVGSLSHDFVWSIAEDPDGALWVGTENGLNRWDRRTEKFTRFRHDPEDPGSLSGDWVWALAVARSGGLWVGTRGGGLARLDPSSGVFERFRHDPDDPAGPPSDEIRALYEDAAGILWVGTIGGGLASFDPARGTWTRFPDVADDRVRSVFGDRSGHILVGTYEAGLSRLDPETGRVDRFEHDPDDPGSLGPGRVRAIYEDRDGVLWVGTDTGLSQRQPETGRFAHYSHDPSSPGTLSHESVSAVIQDRSGLLWVGTQVGGLNKANPRGANFNNYRAEPGVEGSLSSDAVFAFAEGLDGALWIGTLGEGLNRLDRESGRFQTFRHDPADPHSLGGNRVMSLLARRDGSIWAGTMTGGLSVLEQGSRRFRRYRHDSRDARSLSGDGVMSLYETREGEVWAGTWQAGLNRYDPASDSFVRYLHDAATPGSLPHDAVTCLLEDEGGSFWVGTRGGGLSRLDRDTGVFESFGHDPDDPASLGGDAVLTLFEDAEGTLWIGLQGGGLNRWERADRLAGRAAFKRYSERDGLPNNHVWGIQGDDEGSLWLSTNDGLARLDPRTEVFESFDSTHGLPGDEFNFGAHLRTRDGEMFFGGTEGITAFFPDRIRRNSYMPPVVLTAFTKFNRRVELESPLVETREVSLAYDDYVFSFQFAALDYTAPENNQYAYKLEGFNDDWIDLGNQRRATYTNLNPGHYVFRVKAANNDGVWNEDGLSLGVVVIPPPWRTWWAYSLYLLAGATALVGYLRGQRAKERREAEYRRKLEREVRERTAELAQRAGELETANQKLEAANRLLEEASLSDALTGLRNRRYLDTVIEHDVALTDRRFEHAQRRGRDPAEVAAQLFIMIDLDGLKQVNDRFGHAAGDRALQQIAELLRRNSRSSDSLIRWGGDEFLLVGSEETRAGAEHIAERIRDAVDTHSFDLGGEKPIRMSCSIGFAFYPFLPWARSAASWEDSAAIADRALYIAKTSGRNAWAGLLAAESSEPGRVAPPPDLARQVQVDPRPAMEAGLVVLRSSLSGERQVVWERE